jgi:anthranilate synthase component 2
MPTYLKITAQDDKGYVLAEAHQRYDVRGVQFHPEAYLTQHGLQMIKNWMK